MPEALPTEHETSAGPGAEAAPSTALPGIPIQTEREGRLGGGAEAVGTPPGTAMPVGDAADVARTRDASHLAQLLERGRPAQAGDRFTQQDRERAAEREAA